MPRDLEGEGGPLARRTVDPDAAAVQFDEAPGVTPNPRFRDPRVARDSLHDMRMPPFMRDSDEKATTRGISATPESRAGKPRSCCMKRGSRTVIDIRIANIIAPIRGRTIVSRIASLFPRLIRP